MTSTYATKRTRLRHALVAGLFVTSATCMVSPAFAQAPTPTPAPAVVPLPPAASGTTNKALAEQLFKEARALVQATPPEYDKACPKFAESQRLDPSGGTALNLALCYESWGKNASAWAAFNEALAYAIKDGRDAREQAAREHIEKLEPLLNRISIKPLEPVPGLKISIDGVAIGEAVWGSPTPVDPGNHVVTASAEGYYEWKWDIEVGEKVDVLAVELPTLIAKPPEVKQPGFGGPEGPPPKKSPLMFVGFGVGVAGVALGSVAAFLALSKNNQADGKCNQGPSGDLCPRGSDGLSLTKDAVTWSWVSTGAFAVGAVGLGLGTYFLLRSPSKPAATAGTVVVPYFGPGQGGLAMTRTF